MAIKIKGKESNEVFEDLTSTVEAVGSERPNIVNNKSSIVKETEEVKGKLFANKKANIGIGITVVVLLVAYAALRFYLLS